MGTSGALSVAHSLNGTCAPPDPRAGTWTRKSCLGKVLGLTRLLVVAGLRDLRSRFVTADPRSWELGCKEKDCAEALASTHSLCVSVHSHLERARTELCELMQKLVGAAQTRPDA